MADKIIQLTDKDGNNIYPVSKLPGNAIVAEDLVQLTTTDLENLTNLITPILLSKVYPIGSIFISTNSTNPGAYLGGTWESIGAGRCLMGVDSSHAAGTTTEAGLPNITGKKLIGWADGSAAMSIMNHNSRELGALYSDRSIASELESYAGEGTTARGAHDTVLNIDASRSNPIYGRSTTVQPPTYNVYMWKRTA